MGTMLHWGLLVLKSSVCFTKIHLQSLCLYPDGLAVYHGLSGRLECMHEPVLVEAFCKVWAGRKRDFDKYNVSDGPIHMQQYVVNSGFQYPRSTLSELHLASDSYPVTVQQCCHVLCCVDELCNLPI